MLFITVAEAEVIVPPGLEVKESSIPKAGRGVFAKCVIPKHDFFGPFVGKKIPAEEAKNYKDSLYVWEVRWILKVLYFLCYVCTGLIINFSVVIVPPLLC